MYCFYESTKTNKVNRIRLNLYKLFMVRSCRSISKLSLSKFYVIIRHKTIIHSYDMRKLSFFFFIPLAIYLYKDKHHISFRQQTRFSIQQLQSYLANRSEYALCLSFCITIHVLCLKCFIQFQFSFDSFMLLYEITRMHI